MAQRGGYGTCPTSQPEHTARVRVSDGIRDADIGAQIQEPLEEIFSRIDQAGPLLEQLGDVNGVLATLHSDRMRGVCSNTVEERRAVFGPNHLPEDPPLTFWAIYQAAWKDSMIQLLTASAIVSLVLGLTVPEPGEATVNYQTGWIEGFAILCSVLIVTSVSSINDYRKEQKFMKLTQANAAQPIQVMRDGEEVTIDVTEIVVGDVVNLVPGLVAPADGLYVRGLSVLMDESSVTGENDAKRKNTEHPIILSGTVVSTAEEAYMVACAVGERSFGGKLLIESKQGSTPRPTPLQERLDDLAELIGRVGLTAALLLFTILGVMEAFRMMQHQPSTDVRHFLDYFLLCVAIVVVAVPEGLPLAVTIALAYSQNKMHDDNNQVRRLRACETMGNATQICSDKTGTLTQNLMSVVQGYVGMQYFSVRRPGDLPEPIDLIKMCQTSSPASSGSPISKSAAAAATSSAASPSSSSEAACPAAFRESVGLLMEGIALNSSSEKVVHHADRDGRTVEPFWQWRSEKGNKTDNALLDFIDRALMKAEDRNNLQRRPHQKLREAYRHDSDYAIFPFTSDRKRMSVVVRRADGTMIHHVKGGSDRILPLCDRYVNESGSVVEMDADARERIQQQVSKLAKAANRTIGIAFTEVIESKSIPTEEPTGPLIWLSLIGIQDPLRPEVVEAVRKCQMAGVTVRMCTGDNIETAVAISRQCGIFNPFYMDLAMTGQEFRNLVYDAYGDESRMEEFWPVLDRMTVMARSQPLDKQLLVLMLMTRGEVVAVTGDGTNDAPALRLANVGFVMRSGTDIAVKSADIVLLDDNFRSVQRAVVWGRCVNDNIRKFLQLQLTVNYVSVALTFIGCIMARGSASPLTTVQLLWVNLIMDTLAALALATEQPTEECLLRGPTSRSAPLISRRMHVTIGVVAAYILGITLAIQYFGNVWFEAGELHSPQHQTIVFNVFVLCTLAHMCNCRKLYEELNAFEGMITRSRPFVMVLLFCLAFQVMAVETFGEFMSVAPLRADQWVGCLVLASVVWLCGIVSRMVLVTEPVFAKEFSPAALDEEAKKMLLKLDAAVAKAQEDGTHANGKYMEDARRLRARAHWRQARQHHINANKIVNAFRRARIEGLDASSTRSL